MHGDVSPREVLNLHAASAPHIFLAIKNLHLCKLQQQFANCQCKNLSTYFFYLEPYLSNTGNLSKLEVCYNYLVILLMFINVMKMLVPCPDNIGNDSEEFSMFVNVWAAKLSIGNLDDQ